MISDGSGTDTPNGTVVELGIEVDHQQPVRQVRFITAQIRERGKQPNFLIGGMDVIAHGISIDAFVDRGNGTLTRILFAGPIRSVRRAFTGAFLQAQHIVSMLEIGGGRGGDCHLWMHTACLRRVHVIECDGAAVEEYRQRLCRSSGGHHVAETDTVITRQIRFRFQIAKILDLPQYQGDATVAVLHFSVSQIINSAADVGRLLTVLQSVPTLLFIAHDHTVDNLPNGEYGVRIQVTDPTGCSKHPLVCPCQGRLAGLATSIQGSTTALSIRESAFSAEWFVAQAESFGRRVGWLEHPYTSDAHWLLRSLVLICLH